MQKPELETTNQNVDSSLTQNALFWVFFFAPFHMHDLNYEHVTLYISRLRKWMVIKVIVGGYMGSSLSKSAKSTAKLGGYFVMNLSIQTTYKAAST